MISEISKILEDKLPEYQKLEYKEVYFENGKYNKAADGIRTTIIQEITAFANADGGILVLGVKEDSNHNPTEIVDVGVSDDNFEEWEQSFRLSISSRIRPVLHGVECHLITYEEKKVIAIKIPKSIVKPHSFFDGNKDSFYVRYGNIKKPMSIDDLRGAFTQRQTLQQKVIDFKNNRISMILDGEIAGEIEEMPLLVLHIIPEWSMDMHSYKNLKSLRYNDKLDVFSPTSLNSDSSRRGRASYNVDGLFISYGYDEFPVMSYTQVFHNGSIESVEARLMNVEKNGVEYIYTWNEIEELLCKRVYDFCSILEKEEIPMPYNVYVTLLNVKDRFTLMGDWAYKSETINRHIIKTVPAYFENLDDFENAIHPLLTNLANVFGSEDSWMYNKDGSPNKEKFKFIR